MKPTGICPICATNDVIDICRICARLQPALVWTKQRPTKDGWYWTRIQDPMPGYQITDEQRAFYRQPWPAEVWYTIKQDLYFRMVNLPITKVDIYEKETGSLEWAGPIASPIEEEGDE